MRKLIPMLGAALLTTAMASPALASMRADYKLTGRCVNPKTALRGNRLNMRRTYSGRLPDKEAALSGRMVNLSKARGSKKEHTGRLVYHGPLRGRHINLHRKLGHQFPTPEDD